MKRDRDKLRELLLHYEALPEYKFPSEATDVFPWEPEEHYHVLLLQDAGLVTPVNATEFRLTNAGHDFIEAMRDEGIWNKTKAAVAQTGGNATLEIVKQIALGFLKKQINDRTGLDI